MIPFDELVQALDRYKRRQAGEHVPEEPARPRSGPGWRGAPGERSAEINLDEVETE
jgi:hypothetical protein